MATNPFDQASRYTAKMNAVGFLCWILNETADTLRFRGWLDTRTLPFPGDPERTCDTVAGLNDADPTIHWAIPIEFSLEPDGALFGRLLVYLGQLWLEKRPTGECGDHYQVGAVVVNLTGRGDTSQDWQFRESEIRTCLQVAERNLANMNAAEILAGIAAGTITRSVLPWVALMQAADESAIIESWKELAQAEPDTSRRADYGGLALVFAEAAGRRDKWKEALKEWNMIQSQQVEEWRAEGEAKLLLRCLELRFPPGPPADLVVRIRATTDPELLMRWFEVAMTVDSLDALEQVMATAASTANSVEANGQ